MQWLCTQEPLTRISTLCLPLLYPCYWCSEDRLKAGAGTALEGAGDVTDNEVVGTVAEGAANQITADDDATIGDRIGMLAEDITAGVVDSGLIENEQALTVIEAAGDVVKEQAEMDPEETSAGIAML